MMLFLIFSSVVLLIFGLANVYIYKRLVKKFICFKYVHKILALALLLLFIVQACFLFFRRSEILGNELYGILAMLYAPTYCFFFMTLLLDLWRFVRFFFAKKSVFHPVLRVVFECVILVAGGFLTYYSIHSAIKIPNVKHQDIYLAHLKQDVKIALLSDIHLGKNLHEKFLDELITKVNLEKSDMVVIVGDLVDTNPKDLQGYISKLDELKAPLGVFYAVGNHEYYQGIYESLELLKTQTKMKILLNDSVDLGFLNIAGLGDLAGLKIGILGPDIARAKVGLDFSKPSILLAHQPKTTLLYDVSDFDLVLSGHTHGGQIFPFMLLVKLNQGFLSGLYQIGENTQLFVSKGAGFWGPSLRTFAENEIVILNLKDKK